MLAFYGIGCDPTDLSLRPPQVASRAPEAVVVHPGAGYPARRWPVERFARVAAYLAENRYDVVLTGTAGERQPAEDVARRAGLPRDSVLAGRTDVEELAALVADAALVVCGDTGVGHLATAYGTPSVVLFGPVPPHRWGPPAGRRQHVALWAGTTGDTFADSPDPGLLQLSTTQVIQQVRRLLDQEETSRRRAPKPAEQTCGETLSSSGG
jgi:ADP-heptose:LPS heptosyltransferase